MATALQCQIPIRPLCGRGCHIARHIVETLHTISHRFDGDGMVHGVRIKDGRAAYHNHFVRTSQFQQEKALGYAAFNKFGDMKGFGFLVQMAVQALKFSTGVLSDKVRHAIALNFQLRSPPFRWIPAGPCGL